MSGERSNADVARFRGMSLDCLIRAAAELLEEERDFGCGCGGTVRSAPNSEMLSLALILTERADEALR